MVQGLVRGCSGRQGRGGVVIEKASSLSCLVRAGKSQQGLMSLDLHVVSPAGQLPDSPTQAQRLRAPKNMCHEREPAGTVSPSVFPALEVSHRALHLLTLLDEAVTETLPPCKEKDIDSLLEGRAAETRNSVDLIFGENTTCQTQAPPKNIRCGELIGNAEQLGSPFPLVSVSPGPYNRNSTDQGAYKPQKLISYSSGLGGSP